MHLELPLEQLVRRRGRGAQLAFAAEVRKVMARRGARPSAEFERLLSVMRYEAPLADLLGLAEELERLTKGSARHWMALSHYTHVNRRKT